MIYGLSQFVVGELFRYHIQKLDTLHMFII